MRNKTETTTAGARTRHKITLAKGGTGEHEVDLASLTIPDLWRVNYSDKVIEVWHLAHDLKRELIDALAQRDEVVAVCKDLVDAIWDGRAEHDGWEVYTDPCRAAIAKAEGSKP